MIGSGRRAGGGGPPAGGRARAPLVRGRLGRLLGRARRRRAAVGPARAVLAGVERGLREVVLQARAERRDVDRGRVGRVRAARLGLGRQLRAEEQLGRRARREPALALALEPRDVPVGGHARVEERAGREARVAEAVGHVVQGASRAAVLAPSDADVKLMKLAYTAAMSAVSAGTTWKIIPIAGWSCTPAPTCSSARVAAVAGAGATPALAARSARRRPTCAAGAAS